jgi:hypothetical protein
MMSPQFGGLIAVQPWVHDWRPAPRGPDREVPGQLPDRGAGPKLAAERHRNAPRRDSCGRVRTVTALEMVAAQWQTSAILVNRRDLMAARMTGVRRAVLVTSALVGAVLAAGPASAVGGSVDGTSGVSAAPSDPITVEVVTVNGSGCAAGTATVKSAADNTSFSVAYANYVAKVGVGAAPTDLRKNCQLSLLVHVPQGFTYAIARADYSGTAQLAAGATGLQRATYYLQGSPADTYSDHTFHGPLSGRWQATDSTATTDLVYAPCGTSRILNVNTELRVDEGTSDPLTTSSSLSMKSTSGSVNTIYRFAWKQCP